MREREGEEGGRKRKGRSTLQVDGTACSKVPVGPVADITGGGEEETLAIPGEEGLWRSHSGRGTLSSGQ